uniref:DUF167 domain-containing protein n=1 Tax=candidate division WOR-3 bacterium TaxID=2052148 RepID=A0A7C4UGL6_UNCW3
MGRLEIKVVTNADREDVKMRNDMLVVYIKEKPIKGRANKRLLKFLKEKTGYDVKIVRGERTNIKLIEFPCEKEKFLEGILKCSIT